MGMAGQIHHQDAGRVPETQAIQDTRLMMPFPSMSPESAPLFDSLSGYETSILIPNGLDVSTRSIVVPNRVHSHFR